MLARIGRLGRFGDLNCPGDPGCPGNPIVLPGVQAVATVTPTGAAVEDLGTGATFVFPGSSSAAGISQALSSIGTGTILAVGGGVLLLLLLTRRRR